MRRVSHDVRPPNHVAAGRRPAARRRAGDDRRRPARAAAPQARGTFVDASGASVGWLRLTEDRRGRPRQRPRQGPGGGPPRHPYPRRRIVFADLRGGRRPLQPARSPARAGEPERAARRRPAEPDRQRGRRRPSRRQHRPGDPVRGRGATVVRCRRQRVHHPRQPGRPGHRRGQRRERGPDRLRGRRSPTD